MNTIKKIVELDFINVEGYKIGVYSIIIIALIIIFTRLALWLIKKALFRKHKHNINESELGNIYALFQIIKYLIWVVAIGFILETIGIKVTVLIAGSAALLVGVGLGLQQTFNDIISGIILLSERTIKINDVLEIDNDVVKIQSIGLRTSTALNRDNIAIIIPNSLITTNKVINWSHQAKKTRFKIDVGVAYGSDVDLVINILEESAFEHPDIFDRKHIEGRLMNFGASSLDFELLFFSTNIFRIGKVKSDIRRIINKKLIEHNINIPFPQMDVHLKNTEKEKSTS